jgi:uncharacterized protein
VAGPAAGVLEDYGCLAEGLLALHQATGEPRWLTVAAGLLDTALAKFADPDTPGAYFDTAADAEKLVRRPADPADNASPAGASALAAALVAASALTGHEHAGRYREAAELAVARNGLLIARAPRFAGHWAAVAEALRSGPIQVAVVAGPDQSARELRTTALTWAPGGAVVLAGAPDQPGVPLLADRRLVDGKPAAYVCRGYRCDRPVTEPAELVSALRRSP